VLLIPSRDGHTLGLWHTQIPNLSLVLLAIAGFFAAIAIWLGGHHGLVTQELRDSAILPIACGLVLFVFLRGGRGVVAISRVLAPIGVISYGMYLWHWVIAQWLLDRGFAIHAGPEP